MCVSIKLIGWLMKKLLEENETLTQIDTAGRLPIRLMILKFKWILKNTPISADLNKMLILSNMIQLNSIMLNSSPSVSRNQLDKYVQYNHPTSIKLLSLALTK